MVYSSDLRTADQGIEQEEAALSPFELPEHTTQWGLLLYGVGIQD